MRSALTQPRADGVAELRLGPRWAGPKPENAVPLLATPSECRTALLLPNLAVPAAAAALGRRLAVRVGSAKEPPVPGRRRREEGAGRDAHDERLAQDPCGDHARIDRRPGDGVLRAREDAGECTRAEGDHLEKPRGQSRQAADQIARARGE